MFTNEEFIDELCTELQQLCTELEKVKTVSEENCGRSITESRRRQHLDYTPDGTRTIKKQDS
ncbi:hypothetical protein Nhal_1186 [Nitrosococcus halophilus Nc 4]|uniref:Uncharacterized protein n=1 Tax=Nitrosococcus halophilus (strain Nc4) TaxID=472759 RepID=D5BZQ3_NITHN|nr:hypothetical protein Nhal_1186 [Nitrosococcus halophilus Nc 4]